jgi:formate-dependent nitrite reductase membrane component NrfD
MSLAMYLYLGGCVASVVLLYLLFRRAGLQKEFGNFLRQLWGGIELFLVAVALWPLAFVIGLLVLAHHLHERKRLAERAARQAEAKAKEGRFSHMSMDALIAEQRRVLGTMTGSEK